MGDDGATHGGKANRLRAATTRVNAQTGLAEEAGWAFGWRAGRRDWVAGWRAGRGGWLAGGLAGEAGSLAGGLAREAGRAGGRNAGGGLARRQYGCNYTLSSKIRTQVHTHTHVMSSRITDNYDKGHRECLQRV